MQRYLRVYRSFFLSSFARELEFRANFFAKVVQNAVWSIFFVMILLVIYGNTKSIAGWSQGDSFILAATIFFLEALTGAFFMSLLELPSQVRLGALDFVVTKPVDSQFWVSLRKFSFDQLGTLIAAIAMIVIGIVQANASPNALDWCGYLALVLCASAMFYSFSLILMTTAVWFIRVDNLWVLAESVKNVARYPLEIYNSTLQRLFLFVIPFGFIATVPSQQLIRGFDSQTVLLGFVWALVSLFVARMFWKFAMRNYTSASS